MTIPCFTSSDLQHSRDQLSTGCTDCGACVKPCAFLQKHGTPGAIARNEINHDHNQSSIAFECSLCGLCTAICPEKLDCVELFLNMRRASVADDPSLLKRFKGLRTYEKIGSSKIFRSHETPAECSSIFFPGCALAGTRPQQTWQLYRHLQQQIPHLGMVLDCCTKPSHDLGDQDHFAAQFGGLCQTLQQQGVTQILTACPNCYQVFKRYAPQFDVKTVYEQLDQGPLPPRAKTQGMLTIHDPCVNRFEPHIHQAVRSLISKSGLEIQEMTNKGKTSLCCGEGGCVMATDKDLALSWRDQRAQQSQERLITTYCAGCVEFLRPVARTVHLIDLLFAPLVALDRKARPAGSIKRYRNRLKLKKKVGNGLNQTTMEDNMSASASAKKRWPKIAMLTALIALVVALKFSGAAEFLDPQQLQQWISSYGLWAPVIFILLYSIAPALFLPGLPLTILAGVIFGPIWGVVYTIIGATIGASIAFLVARYTARDWISGKLTAPRWKKLDEDVARQGWKVVAFTRLIPLFPFNLLNYAFGLTNVRFSHYVVTSFICMLPATIAFISLSSSLGQLLKGQISKEFIIGIALITALSLLPILWKKRAAKKGEDSPREPQD